MQRWIRGIVNDAEDRAWSEMIGYSKPGNNIELSERNSTVIALR
jgi:hypothetical protein